MRYKLAVIGSPIAHSFSPLIHKTFLEYMNIDCEYSTVDVKKGELETYISYVRENSVLGFNVTMPHKQDIIRYLDEIDYEADIFNSVNTVKNKNGRLIGYNTDAQGYMMSLSEIGVSFNGLSIVVNGAGGAASALVLKAALEGARCITVLNKNLKHAEQLAKNVLDKTNFSVKSELYTINNLEKACQNVDLFINATPLGMHGIDADYSDLSFIDKLKENSIVSDLIYNPYKTRLLKYAENKGLKTINGLGMLIYQGLIADSIYFNKDFDFKAVKQLIEEKYNSKI